MADIQKIERADDYASTPTQLYQREISAARKELEKFHERGKKARERYLDEREGAAVSANRMNLWWSDTNVMTGVIYSRQPKADVSRKHKDAEDDVARVAGEMIQRILNVDMQSQTSDIHLAFEQAVEDRLIPGMGQVWLRYEPEMAMVPNPAYQQSEMLPIPVPTHDIQPEIEVIADEHVPVDHVHWEDFYWSPARTWKEVRWVARAIYMTRDELVERFGPVGEEVPLNVSKTSGDGSISRNDPWEKARVWEIWGKEKRAVCWFVEGFDKLLDEKPDPLKLAGFFPCPEPFSANVTTSSYVPKSDYTMLSDSYEELNTVQNRITLLEQSLRVVGAYDKTNPALKRMVDGHDNTMIEVDNWAMFAEKGGIKGTVDWFPIDMVAGVLDTLMMKVKPQIIADLRELRGISDIMRGETKAQETLGAQQLKAEFGSVRLQPVKGKLAKFVQQALTIKAEIIAAHFQPETIKRQSLIEKTPDAALADPAIALLKDKRMAAYSLQVDPDTMAMINYGAEQRTAAECITAVGTFITAMTPLIQMKPEVMPVALHLLQYVLSKFKAGQQIEGIIDQAIRQLMAAPQTPDPKTEAMKDAQLKKVQSEGTKNESAAVLNIESARAKQMEPIIDLVEATKPEPKPQFPQGGGP